MRYWRRMHSDGLSTRSCFMTSHSNRPSVGIAYWLGRKSPQKRGCEFTPKNGTIPLYKIYKGFYLSVLAKMFWNKQKKESGYEPGITLRSVAASLLCIALAAAARDRK